MGQNVPSGHTTSLELPADLRRGVADGQAHIAHLSNGRVCILLKTRVGYKDNFSGRVACTAPFSASEVIEGDRPYLSLAGHGVFEELYIRRRPSDRMLDVYFDLKLRPYSNDGTKGASPPRVVKRRKKRASLPPADRQTLRVLRGLKSPTEQGVGPTRRTHPR